MNWFLAAFIAAQAADAGTTLAVLHQGGRELNPLVSNHAAQVITVKATSSAVYCVIAKHLGKKHPRAAKVTTLVLAGVLAGVAIHNGRYLR